MDQFLVCLVMDKDKKNPKYCRMELIASNNNLVVYCNYIILRSSHDKDFQLFLNPGPMQDLIENIRRYTRTIVRELKVLRGTQQGFGVSLSQCHFLFELQQAPGQNLHQISETLVLDKSTTSRLSASLAKKGLIDTAVPAHDQRQKHYCLTSAGIDTITKSNEWANHQVQEALELLSPEEQEKVQEGMRLYAKALARRRRQNHYQIRPIQKADNAMVAQLIRQVMTEFGAVGEGYSINDPEVDDMYGTYQGDNAMFYVIEDGHSILGCGGIGPLTDGSPDTCELKKMYFYPELRGAGMGKKLMHLCLEKAREMGYRTVYLETIERMWQAVRLYEKAGFKKLQQPLGCTGHSSCESYYAMEL